MLTKEALLNVTAVITGFYDMDDLQASWHSEYNYRVEKHEQFHIILGWYTQGDYCGDSYMFGYDKEKDQFFENEASHCSCCGLEEGWSPQYFDSVELLEKYLIRCGEKGYYPEQRTLIAFLKKNGIEL